MLWWRKDAQTQRTEKNVHSCFLRRQAPLMGDMLKRASRVHAQSTSMPRCAALSAPLKAQHTRKSSLRDVGSKAALECTLQRVCKSMQ